MRTTAALVFVALTCLFCAAATPPRPLEELEQGKYLKYSYNDGDSFKASYERDDKRIKGFFRLYFVDAIESRDKSKDDQRKLAEQAKYFGIPSDKQSQLTAYGEQARDRV